MARSRAVVVENNIDDLAEGIRDGIVAGLESLEQGSLDQIDEGFENEQDAMGNDWAELSPVTVAAKGDDTILFEHGDLRDSFEGDLDVHNYELEVFTDDDRARIHEFGAYDRDPQIPARPMVLPAAMWTEEEGVEEYFVPALQAASLGAVGVTVTSAGTDWLPDD